MKRLSHQQKTYRTCMFATAALTLIYTAVFLVIFYRQYYWEDRRIGFYMSDTHPHIAFGQSGKSLYSIMYLALGALDRLPQAGMWIAAYLALFLLFGGLLVRGDLGGVAHCGPLSPCAG